MYKLFIGGISQDTTEADLKDYFTRFGVISSFIIMQDKATKKSKGYGFINCENKKTYQRILETKAHQINGRRVDVNKALSKNSDVPADIKSKGFRKLFVGGLPLKSSTEDIEKYFSRFGKVLNAYLIFDPQTKVSKNFGYVEFEDVAVAEAVLNISDHEINGKKVTVENHKNGLNAAINFGKRQQTPNYASCENCQKVPLDEASISSPANCISHKDSLLKTVSTISGSRILKTVCSTHLDNKYSSTLVKSTLVSSNLKGKLNPANIEVLNLRCEHFSTYVRGLPSKSDWAQHARNDSNYFIRQKDSKHISSWNQGLRL